jgi:hypothetical protein
LQNGIVNYLNIKIMSIFNAQKIKPNVEQLAQRIKVQASRIPEQMVNNWMQTYNLVWSDGVYTAEEKIAALGTDAGELFKASEDFIAFIIGQLTGKRDDLVAEITEIIASNPTYTINPDGTVTLDAVE